MTMSADDPKWSFIRIGPEGWVTEVQEKTPISSEATVGIYNFAKGQDFVRAATEMMALGMVSAGEYYVAPVYNLLIEAGARVGFHNVGSESDSVFGLGTPEDLKNFIELPISKTAISGLA